MPEISVSEIDLEKARSQVELLKEMLVDYQLNPQANAVIIAKIEADIGEITAEARVYDLKLNPRPMPSICGLCNLHPKVETRPMPCPECGNKLINCQPPEGIIHWKVPGAVTGLALSDGEVPA